MTNMKFRKISFLLLCVLIIGGALSSVFRINERKATSSNDLSSYLSYSHDMYLSPQYKDAPVVFPNAISENYTVNNYNVVYINQAFSNVGFHFYIDITYSNQDYLNEINRLETWERQYNYEGNIGTVKLLKDAENFNYTTYVASYNCALAYEYASIIGENRILYVYISRIQQGETDLSDAFLPKQYYNHNFSLEGFTYSIYHDYDMYEYDK